MTILGPSATARRLLLAFPFVAGFACLAPATVQAQNLVDVRVPNFRAPIVRAPDLRVPDIRLPNVQAPQVTVRPIRAADFRAPIPAVPLIRLPQVALPPAPDLGSGLVFHGNYCGPGSRGPGRRPVDALDAACARHDSCTPPPGALTSCGCNARLQREATAVAMSPRTPDDTRAAARFIAEGVKLMACR